MAKKAQKVSKVAPQYRLKGEAEGFGKAWVWVIRKYDARTGEWKVVDYYGAYKNKRFGEYAQRDLDLLNAGKRRKGLQWYIADGKKLVTRTSAMNGAKVQEAKDTPFACSVASESYWSS